MLSHDITEGIVHPVFIAIELRISLNPRVVKDFFELLHDLCLGDLRSSGDLFEEVSELLRYLQLSHLLKD